MIDAEKSTKSNQGLMLEVCVFVGAGLYMRVDEAKSLMAFCLFLSSLSVCLSFSLLPVTAIYLCKRTMQNKTRLELADYEAVSDPLQ